MQNDKNSIFISQGVTLHYVIATELKYELFIYLIRKRGHNFKTNFCPTESEYKCSYFVTIQVFTFFHKLYRNVIDKGQLIFKAKFLLLIWTKIRTKLFFDSCLILVNCLKRNIFSNYAAFNELRDLVSFWNIPSRGLFV